MWIEADAKHWMIVDASKLDTLYINYRGPSSYAVVGTIGDRDLTIKLFKTESDAVSFCVGLRAKLDE